VFIIYGLRGGGGRHLMTPPPSEYTLSRAILFVLFNGRIYLNSIIQNRSRIVIVGHINYNFRPETDGIKLINSNT
jgi:hypothetical protein